MTKMKIEVAGSLRLDAEEGSLEMMSQQVIHSNQYGRVISRLRIGEESYMKKRVQQG